MRTYILTAILLCRLQAAYSQPCPGMQTVTDVDGNLYNTVQIGSQCWMKENLKATRYRNGTSIIYPSSNNTSWVENKAGAYAWYNNDISSKNIYGALYNWFAVNNPNGLCPTGWHVPTDAEWAKLTISLGGNSVAGGKLKASGTSFWASPNTGATNETGFTALPGGFRTVFGDYMDITGNGWWWSSTSGSTSAWVRAMFYNATSVYRATADHWGGLSVRCLKDESAQVSLPTINTVETSNITARNATSGGNVTADGGAAVTARGVVWSTIQNPTLASNNGFTADGGDLGAFTSTLSNLTPGTTYFVRAYATNSAGTAYGNQLSFRTISPGIGQPCPDAATVTDIDGNRYNTVQIGSQCWMKENLKTTRFRDGSPIALPGDDLTAWQSNTSGAFAWFENDIVWKDKYGALYNWHAVENQKGLCPPGWNVPSNDQWDALIDYLISQGYPNSNVANAAGNALKSCRQADSPFGGECNITEHPRWWVNHTHNGFDAYGFSGLPGGIRPSNGGYGDLGFGAFFWTSSEFSSAYARFKALYYTLGYIQNAHTGKNEGISVRCLKSLGTIRRGDANCNGIVDVLDIIVIVNYIMGQNPDPFCFDNANLNGDNQVDVLDIIATVNIIMGN